MKGTHGLNHLVTDLALFAGEGNISLQSLLGQHERLCVILQSEITVCQIKGMHRCSSMHLSVMLKHSDITPNLLRPTLLQISGMPRIKACIPIDKYPLPSIVPDRLLMDHPFVVKSGHSQNPRTPHTHCILHGILCHKIAE